jgi:hypothetical protein
MSKQTTTNTNLNKTKIGNIKISIYGNHICNCAKHPKIIY